MTMLSIIIPVYNGANYIQNCYNSIKENLSFVDKEIIFVNNGSTDNSLELLNEIEDKSVHIITTDTKGVSNARNIGINHAKGKWLFFMDVDDTIAFVDRNFLNVLHEDFDIVWIIYNKVQGNNNFHSYNSLIKEGLYDILEFSKIWHGEGMVWPFMFRRSLVKNLFFTEMSFFEDSDFLYHYLANVKNVYLSHNMIYSYFIRADSTMQAAKLEKKYVDAVTGLVRNQELLMSISHFYKKVLGPHIVKNYLWVIRSAPSPIFKKIYHIIKERNLSQSLLYGNLKQIIMASVCMFSINLFRYIFRFKV